MHPIYDNGTSDKGAEMVGDIGYHFVQNTTDNCKLYSAINVYKRGKIVKNYLMIEVCTRVFTIARNQTNKTT